VRCQAGRGLSAEGRVGARRIKASVGACDRCVFKNDAFVAEYLRGDALTIGGTHQLALLWQHESGMAPFYLIGGPSAAVDDDGAPGSGIGAKLGFGMHLGGRTSPLFAELTVAELTRSNSAIVRAGLHAGLVW